MVWAQTIAHHLINKNKIWYLYCGMGAICMFGSCLHSYAHAAALFVCSIPVIDATDFMRDFMKDKHRIWKTSHACLVGNVIKYEYWIR